MSLIIPFINSVTKFITKAAFVTGFVLLTSCFEFIPEFDISEIEGYKPVYAPADSEVLLEAPIPFVRQGKIYHYSHYILVEETGRGFHIIENIDNTAPQKVGFFQIPLNTNIAIRGNTVYANSGPDLLALIVLDDGKIEVNKLANVFESANTKDYPPESGIYFECVDNLKGEVIGWELVTIYDPKCYY